MKRWVAVLVVAAVGCEPQLPEPQLPEPQAPELQTPQQMRASLSPYELDITEVTVVAYRACAKAGGCTEEGLDKTTAGDPSYCNYSKSDREDHPINCVNWHQAEAYCKWAGKRLPTEQEWEYAASSGKGWTHPWGDSAPDLSKLCWSRWHDGKGDGTCKVGSYPAGDNLFGVKDLAGNVWEWTSSNYDATDRVFRGGGWYFDVAGDVRASRRSGVGPSVRHDFLGFRCARSLP